MRATLTLALIIRPAMADLELHFHGDLAAGAVTINVNPGNGEVLAAITTLQEQMTMDHQAALDAVTAANTLLDKIGRETDATLEKVTALELVIASMNQAGQTIPQPLADAITALTEKVRAIDVKVPDATDPA